MSDDAPVFPAAWHDRLHPRADGPVPPDAEVNASLAEDTLRRIDAMRAPMGKWLGKEWHFEDGLTERAHAYLNGEADPVGAAATLVALSHTGKIATGFHGPGGPRAATRYDGFADAWTAEHGLAFAVAAFVELSAIEPECKIARSECTKGARYALDGYTMDLWWAARHGGARRMRELAAAADGAVLDRLARLRTTPVRRIVASYLAPARTDWLDACLAEADAPPTRRERTARWMPWCSVSSAAQFERARDVLGLGPYELVPDVLATVLERVGPAALAPVLGEVLDGALRGAERDAVLDLLTAVPADATFAVLAERAGRDGSMHVRRALDAAARRFPERARRLLPPRPAPAPRRFPDAPDRDLPPTLVHPPWTWRTPAPDPIVVPGLAAPAERTVVWAPGERERWADAPGYRPERLGYGRYDEELARAVKQYRRRNASPQQQVVMFLHAPDDMVGPLLPAWTPPAGLGRVPEWTRPLVARHGAGVRDHAVRAARANPAGAGGLLVPFRDAEVAALMAEWLDRRPAARTHVRAWFDRHGAEAARLLVPAALAAPGAERGRAERALRFVAARTGDASVVEAARGYGDAAVGAVRAFLADTPFVGVPGRAPRPPAWADPAALPQVPLRGRAAALPAGAVTALVTMLMIADADPVFDGVRPAAAACDPVSLAEFAWALFERWLDHGAPPRHAWAMASLGLLGDDETVRRLVPLIRDWPGEGLHHRAAAGLDVLAALGTPVALLHLHGLTRGRGYPGAKARARELFHQWAARAGVPPERLAERLVPGYDLDAEGGTTLDYGPRRFRAGFDERLEPYVADGSGRRLAAPPEPGTRDDPELAAAARRRFTAMKAEVRTASAYLVERLEKAMARRYAWTPDEFRALFAEHPIVRHIARRLVWTAGGAAFRLAEDGTLADVHDDAFVPPAGAAVRVAHPLDLGDDLARWRATFDDYELDQPFHQLHRPVHLVTEDERAAGRIRRFDGLAVHHRRFRAMEHRGWERAKGRAGMDERFSRRHPGGLAVGLELEWEFAAEEENCDRWRVRELTIDAPDAALASEALADVVRLIGPRRIAAARRP